MFSVATLNNNNVFKSISSKRIPKTHRSEGIIFPSETRFNDICQKELSERDEKYLNS
jgi:hypothetical protein